MKILELRALMSLIKIGRTKDESIRMLQDTYQWFSEGFDMQDLSDARNLLEKK